jgi:hypothetical protein
MTDPSLDHISTDDLLAELRSRSKTMFFAMRPLADHADFTAIISMGVDGRKPITADDRDRCLGLAQQAMIYAVPKDVGEGK